MIEEYIHNAKNNLGVPHTGGTDWRCITSKVMDAFKKIIFIAKPSSILEIGFNAGGSALAFLMIKPKLVYDSIDIVENEKSQQFLKHKYRYWRFFKMNSRSLDRTILFPKYDMVLIDGDHSEEGVRNDIEQCLLFNPEYILLDDVLHPAHSYIHNIILEDKRLELVKLYEFNEIWQGYSFALCKVIV